MNSYLENAGEKIVWGYQTEINYYLLIITNVLINAFVKLLFVDVWLVITLYYFNVKKIIFETFNLLIVNY